MAKTFNRTPFSVREPNFEYKFFNHVNWKGLCTDKNYFNIDQETFEDCENVYIDSEGLLKSRPAIKTVHEEAMPAVFKQVFGAYVDNEKFNIYDVKYNSGIFVITFDTDGDLAYVVGNSTESAPPIKLPVHYDIGKNMLLDDNVFLYYKYGDDVKSLRVRMPNIANEEYVFYDVKDFVYAPVKNIITNGIKKENESDNLWSKSYIDRYIYDDVNSLVNPLFVDKVVDIKTATESVNYENVEFKRGLENLIFIPSVNVSPNNYYTSRFSSIRDTTYPLMDFSNNGVILMSYYNRNIDENSNITEHWKMTYSVDGRVFNSIPNPPFAIFGKPVISKDGSFVVVFGADGPYAYSILADLPNDQKRFGVWTNLLLYNNLSTSKRLSIGDKITDTAGISDSYKEYANNYKNDIVGGYFNSHSDFFFCHGAVDEQPWKPTVDFLFKHGQFVTYMMHYVYVNDDICTDFIRSFSEEQTGVKLFICNTFVDVNYVTYSIQGVQHRRICAKYIIEDGLSITNELVTYDIFDFCKYDDKHQVKYSTFSEVPEKHNDKSNFIVMPPAEGSLNSIDIVVSKHYSYRDYYENVICGPAVVNVDLDDMPENYVVRGGPFWPNSTKLINESLNLSNADEILLDYDKNLYVSEDNEIHYYSYDNLYNSYVNALIPHTNIPKRIVNTMPNISVIADDTLYSNDWKNETLLIDVTNEGEITPIFFDHETTLNVKYLSKGNTLYISSNRYDDDGNKLIYFPKINEQNENFTSNITNLHPISKTQVGIFFEDEIWYVENTEQGYNYYKSKLKVGCKEGGDVITSADGQHIIFSTNRGLAYMSYQDFVQSTDQTLTFLSDAISELYFEFAKKPVKLFQYKYWIICWHTDENDFLVFDARNNSWWKWSWRKKIKCVHTINDELYFVSTEDDNPSFCYSIDKSDVDYSDDGEFIKWSLTSQKLHLGTLNYYKNIHSITINNVQTGDNINEVSFDMSIVNYRNQVSNRYEEPVNIEYQVNLLRSYVKRCNSKKVNEFQYKLSNADERITQHTPLSVNSIIIKYSLGGQIR